MPAVTEVKGRLDPAVAGLAEDFPQQFEPFGRLVGLQVIKPLHPLFGLQPLLRHPFAHVGKKLTLHNPFVHCHTISSLVRFFTHLYCLKWR